MVHETMALPSCWYSASTTSATRARAGPCMMLTATFMIHRPAIWKSGNERYRCLHTRRALIRQLVSTAKRKLRSYGKDEGAPVVVHVVAGRIADGITNEGREADDRHTRRCTPDRA